MVERKSAVFHTNTGIICVRNMVKCLIFKAKEFLFNSAGDFFSVTKSLKRFFMSQNDIRYIWFPKVLEPTVCLFVDFRQEFRILRRLFPSKDL